MAIVPDEDRAPSVDDSTESRRALSRRVLLKRAGLAGAATVLPASLAVAAPAEAAPERIALMTLSAQESATLNAICARLIPTDANGPGAVEARAMVYIDRALATDLTQHRDTYSINLAALDAYATRTQGTSFAQLSPDKQDAVLTAVQNNVATGFTPNAATFFGLVREHTLQGTFCDPYYVGNANFVGWDMIGYPGVKLTNIPAREQQLDVVVPRARKSTYDYAMFKPQTATTTTKKAKSTKGSHYHAH
jgi:gluconate 2-dehydrogenase gamma chain